MAGVMDSHQQAEQLGGQQLAEQQPKRLNPFLLGADPEFVLLQEDGLALSDVHRAFSVSENPEIGWDCRVLVELRPKPARTAYELTARIRSLLLSPTLAESNARDYKWRAGAVARYRYCRTGQADCGDPTCQDCHPPAGRQPRTLDVTMGGHLHYETKYWKMAVDPQTGRDSGTDYPQAKPLDRLTALLEHLDLLPEKECEERRKTSGYGGPNGNVRPSARSYEYRRMCSWLFHPRIAFIVLALSKLCVVDYETTASALYHKTSFDALKKLVEPYAPHDDDAARLHEVLFPRGLEAMRADHTLDFKAAWRKWQPELGGNPT